MGRPFSIYRAIPEAIALDAANDVRALAGEGMTHLQRAYHAHLKDDWMVYLNETQDVVDRLYQIGERAKRWAADVEGSPLIPPGQIQLALAA